MVSEQASVGRAVYRRRKRLDCQIFKGKTEENQGNIERTGESITAFSGFSVFLANCAAMPCQRYRGAPPYGRDVSPAHVIARQNHAHDLPVFLRYRDCVAKSGQSRLRSRPSCSAPYLYRYAIAPKRWYSRLKSFAECAYFISQAVHRQSVDHPSLYSYTSCPAWISRILLCVIVSTMMKYL